jgi:type VI secretion system protein ImpB
VEVGDAIELKEIPFVMGVLADLSGKPEEPLPRLKERRFVEVTPDNFRQCFGEHEAEGGLHRREQAERRPNAGKIGVDLRFSSMDDFEPENVARQVKPLRDLLDLRDQAERLAGHPAGQ